MPQKGLGVLGSSSAQRRRRMFSNCGGYKPIVKMWLTILNNYVNYGRENQRANHAYKAAFWCAGGPFGQAVDLTISLPASGKAK